MRRILAFWILAAAAAAQTAGQVEFSTTGYTDLGEWSADIGFNPPEWRPGARLNIGARIYLTAGHLQAFKDKKIELDKFVLLVTAERTFDAEGRLRLPSDERMSTLLTPSGLPIEGGVQGAVTNRYGYAFTSPVDLLLESTLLFTTAHEGGRIVTFAGSHTLPAALPPGIYRLRFDFGVAVGRRLYDLNAGTFGARPFFKGRPTESHVYSPPVRAHGQHVSGRDVDASTIQPRIPWVLLNSYNSNGYRGVVAEEDKAHFNLSGRNLIQDDVILPLYNTSNQAVTYSLEPQFPSDTIELRNNLPWDFTKGEMTVEVTAPDGKVTSLGTFPFAGAAGQWPTTKNRAVTQWRPPAYGQYSVKVTGWTSDAWGNRYEGGGTYKFWIAKRMTMATATFQGMAYPVGNRYGRDIGFAPAVPANVTIRAALYPNSDPGKVKTLEWSGQASSSGVYGAAQGSKNLPFDEPGEYAAHVLATYIDGDKHLWVCSMRHAGVVYPADSPIVARGKKLYLGGKYYERGETKFEGYVDAQGNNFLAHINYPWNQGDVLLIASEGQGANKIEPVLNYEWKDKPQAYESRLNGVGASNLRLRTSNNYSPHLFPEYITEWAYYYGAAPRPGFMSRFLVSEDGTRAPYWSLSPNSFGGQINASSNGDIPGDIYRLIGGIVLRRPGEKPAYAGYLASAFLLPKGTNNNRVVAPGSEDVLGPYGEKARVFLVGTRPGMVYPVGSLFGPAFQIDPVLPANIHFSLEYPDGHLVQQSGVGDAFGSFAGSQRWVLNQPGVYRYRVSAEWQGHKAVMPGLPPEGGELYVIDADPPAVTGFKLNLPPESSFNPEQGLSINGNSTASSIRWAAVIPGAVIGQGEIPVINGRFEFRWEPRTVNQRTETYDTVNRVNGRPEIGDVVHLTFFSKENTPTGDPYHVFHRVIIRGTRVFCTK